MYNINRYFGKNGEKSVEKEKILCIKQKGRKEKINMEMQNQIKEYVAQYEKEVRKLADQLRNECMPQPTEELFSEFETNGNRMRYEAVYFGRRKFLSVLGLASVIWHEKEDIQKLEEVIREICAEECWALPAHV